MEPISITDVQAAEYLAATRTMRRAGVPEVYASPYIVMVKGYGDDWDEYNELNIDDLDNDNVIDAGYEDYQLWLNDTHANREMGEGGMSYRLHYAQHYEPDWQGGFLSGYTADNFANLVRGEFADNYWMPDDENECELDRPDIESYIERLEQAPEAVNPYFDFGDADERLTNRQVSDVFKELLKSDDYTIHMEWF